MVGVNIPIGRAGQEAAFWGAVGMLERGKTTGGSRCPGSHSSRAPNGDFSLFGYSHSIWAPTVHLTMPGTINQGKCASQEVQVTILLGAEAAWLARVPAHPQPQCALCLLHHCASAPNLTAMLSWWPPPSHSLKGFIPALGNVTLPITLSSLLSSGSCAPVSSHCPLSPCPRLAATLLLGVQGGAWVSQKQIRPWAECSARLWVPLPHGHLHFMCWWLP